MSVRRLAEDNLQPESFKFNRTFAAEAKVWVKKYPKGREQSAVIPLLMLAQEQDGWVTKTAIEYIADMLGMPYIRALEVATFYTQFQLKPVGTRAHIQICGTTPCMLRGSEELISLCKKRINPEPFKTNEAGTMSWEEVECQGACVNAPMVMVFKDAYEDLTPERLSFIIERFEAGKGDDVPTGPQIDRIFSAPEGGPVTLLEDPSKKRSSSAAKKAPTKNAATKKAPVKAAAKAKPAAAKATVSKTAAVKAPAKSPASKPAAVASLDDKNRPPKVRKPAKPDDLKLISGVGPKLEGVLNGLGIYKFEQVSKWKKAEREWVDGYLKFKGRIDRDDWIKQAKALAKGGEAEYIKVFGKKPR
jgi:NADH-quinone oxidoreductase subunit E